MSRYRRNLQLVALMVLAAATLGLGADRSTAASAARPSRGTVPGELLVGFRSDVSDADQQKILKKAGALEKRRFKGIHGTLAAISPDAVQSAIDRLRADPRVRYAEPNELLSTDALPNDPLLPQLWGLTNTGQNVGGFVGTPGADISAPEAWSITTGSSSVTVAVIDTGIDYTHPDLSPSIWINQGENCAGCRTDGIDNDGNGYVDDWRGWDFANNDNAPLDDHGHGTHVAGTIGAVGDNGIGVSGVSWNVRLMPLKFLNASGQGAASDAVSAILYAASQGADVINASWGGDGYSQALSDAIAAAGAHGSLFVAAAGNSSSDNDADPAYPASYDLPNVISVAATDSNDDLAWFSNVGQQSVDLGAPGVNIYSTYPGGRYQYLSGTSMAAPHVSGAAALVKAAFPSAGALGVKAQLLGTVDPDDALAGLTTTGGRLNAGAAVTCSNAPALWPESPSNGFATDVGKPLTVTAIAAHCASPDGLQLSATANGTPLQLTARGDGLYTATYTPTTAGQLTFSFTASFSGASTTRTVTGTASEVLAISPGGPPVTATTTATDQNVRLRFDGQAGQRISLKLSTVTIPSSYISILAPDGSALGTSTYVGTSGGFADTRTLPTTGSYSILVDPQGTGTGSLTLTLYDVPPDVSAAATFGADQTFTTTVPGQNARLSFDGRAGQRISAKFATAPTSTISILKPDGTALGGTSYIGASGGFVDTRTLPVDGTYSLVADPQGPVVGTTTVRLYDVPADATATLAANGSPLLMTLGTPGQNGRFTLDGRAGERLSVKLAGSTISSALVSLLKPDGATLGSYASIGTSGGFLDTRALPGDGTYTILVDPQGAATGSLSVAAYDVPADVAGTIVPGGAAFNVTIPTPGQNARLTFGGTTGQRVSIRVGSTQIASSYLSLLKPDGTPLGSTAFFGTSGGFVDTRTLPADGTYTIVVDPQGAATGSAAVTLYGVPPDATGTLAAGTPLPLTIGTPGQNARVVFSGTAGQTMRLSVVPTTLSISYLSVVRPDGSTLVASTFVTSSRTFTATLTATGTYAIVIDPYLDGTGILTLTLG
jgi:hypothetical protein